MPKTLRLNNKRVANFLGMSVVQMNRMIKCGDLPIAITKGSKTRTIYYIYSNLLEDWLKRDLREDECKYLFDE